MRLVSKLVKLATLEEDWDTYGAPPPAKTAIVCALHCVLNNRWALLPEDLLPSIEGGVTLVYAQGSRGYAEIEFDNDGEVVAAFKRPGEHPEVWLVPEGHKAVQGAVTRLRRALRLDE